MLPAIQKYKETIESNGLAVFNKLQKLTLVAEDHMRTPWVHASSSTMILKVTDGKRNYAVKLFAQQPVSNVIRYNTIISYLSTKKVAWKYQIKCIEDEITVEGQRYPVVGMSWVEGVPFTDYVQSVLHDNSALRNLQRQLLALSVDLEGNSISHGYIEPGNLIIYTTAAGEVQVRLIDFDEMYVPGISPAKTLLSTAAFRHPRHDELPFDERRDRFSFWVLLCALEALKFDKSLFDSKQSTGDLDCKELFFTAFDWLHYGQSGTIQRLYEINEPSLNFYLYALNRFCNSASLSIEAPEMHGYEIGVGAIEAFQDDAAPAEIIIKQGDSLHSSPGTSTSKDAEVKHQIEATHTPPRPSQVAQAKVPLIQSRPEREYETEGNRSLMITLVAGFAIILLVAMVNSYLKRTGGEQSPQKETRNINKFGQPFTAKNTEMPQNVESRPGHLDTSGISAGLREIYEDRIKQSNLEQDLLIEKLKIDPSIFKPKTELRKTLTVDTVDTSALKSEVAEPLAITAIEKFFELVAGKDCETAWELAKVPEWTSKGKDWFCSDKGYGFTWDIRVDDIQTLKQTSSHGIFRVNYYTYDLYEGARCFDQEIEVRLARTDEGNREWIITRAKNNQYPQKCKKRED